MKPSAIGIQYHVNTCVLFKTKYYGTITVFNTM